MKVVFHPDFHQVYTSDPAAAPGRLDSVMNVIQTGVEFVEARPASEERILAVHDLGHVDRVRREGVFDIAALAAGGAIQAAEIGLKEPCFGLLRPPGHHASRDSSWGFCYFNNMAVALMSLKMDGLVNSAYVLDIDLHFGDGTENVLGASGWAVVHNVSARDRKGYLEEVALEMERCQAEIIGISAGFDHHEQDWGGLLATEDYYEIGLAVRKAARRLGGGCFAILEGGYNHQVLGQNVLALIQGLGTDR